MVGLVGYLSGAPLVGAIATGFALAAALLNAAFGFCLGCEMYLLIRRIAPNRTSTSTPRLTVHQPIRNAANRAENTKEEEAVA